MAKRTIRRRPGSEPESTTPNDDAPKKATAAGHGTRSVRTPRKQRKPAAPKPQAVPASERLAELEALASGQFDMDALFGDVQRAPQLPGSGTKVTGTVSQIQATDVYVDLGLRSTGFIPRAEAPEAQVGDTITAFVVYADDDGVRLSTQLSGEAAESLLEDAFEAQIPVEGKVVGHHAGGYDVKIGSTRAFAPHRHISRLPVASPDALVGQSFQFLVLEMDERIIVSRKALEEKAIEAQAAAFREAVEPGMKVKATLTSIQPWGAFADVQGCDARLPKNLMSWEAIDPLSTFQRGQEVDAVVDNLNGSRITLSLRDPSLDPWKQLAGALSAGSTVSGEVANVVDFGAFITLRPGIDGLLPKRFLKNRSLAKGDAITVVVTELDLDRRRISLAPEGEEANAASAASEEDVAWRRHKSDRQEGSMGTLADLFGGLKKRR